MRLRWLPRLGLALEVKRRSEEGTRAQFYSLPRLLLALGLLDRAVMLGSFTPGGQR